MESLGSKVTCPVKTADRWRVALHLPSALFALSPTPLRSSSLCVCGYSFFSFLFARSCSPPITCCTSYDCHIGTGKASWSQWHSRLLPSEEKSVVTEFLLEVLRTPLFYMAFTSGSSVVIVMEYIRGLPRVRCHEGCRCVKSLLDMMRFFDQNQFRPSLVVKNAMKHPFFEGELAFRTYQIANHLHIHADGVSIHRCS
ncbi:hypothetical protein EDD15DRAFT_1144431 [Pisolithus albus]|nr:hypothetical protein EDD15DRAFT_1144431 [Pisolithus albus]